LLVQFQYLLSLVWPVARVRSPGCFSDRLRDLFLPVHPVFGPAVSLQGGGGCGLGHQHVGVRYAHALRGVGGDRTAAGCRAWTGAARLLSPVRRAISADAALSVRRG